ncbi:MAG: hypothetical protein M3R22_11740 [Pseudomonadota bacterium]|nr:hypothetical protein [Pseudomonadota bacterium]
MAPPPNTCVVLGDLESGAAELQGAARVERTDRLRRRLDRVGGDVIVGDLAAHRAVHHAVVQRDHVLLGAILGEAVQTVLIQYIEAKSFRA